MNIEQPIDKELLVQDALKKAISYSDYEALMADLVAHQSNTGPEVTEALANYTMLNKKRMDRWSKKFQLTEADKRTLEKLQNDTTWLVITESWCGDAAQTMPMMQKIAEATNKIDLKVVLRDQNPFLMDQFLTLGARSIPKLIALDKASGTITGTWGPRPTEATKLVEDYKAEHGTLTPDFKQALQVWYNKDKGRNTVQDLLALLTE